MIQKVFEYLAKVLVIFASVVTMVEGTGETGEAKKEQAKTEIKSLFEQLAADGKVPTWLSSIVTNDMVLDFLIDKIVAYANDQNWFEKSYEILKGAE
ncbi:hypothetical protein P22_1973 [Propionispora sp. 2/2-37]|uniref:hypothetical protein n=1 Tax=Propionispora sp. 2/2-37 TaxID=1677858 RepID=UPI0006BB5ECA|nr:hypothetical protein [Propionispora sp. 2/2-37]CUH95887.1 hypothetical protein P22_1973 [Propionispora sp. 2/2-37]